MKSIIIILVLVSFGCVLNAQSTVDVYIVEGGIKNGNQEIPYFTYNTRNQFDSANTVLRFSLGEEVTFNITNNVDFTCGFEIIDHVTIDAIASGETVTQTVVFDETGTFLYQDPRGDHRALGLGGMLVVSDFNGPEFYGVFTEHEPVWIEALAEGGSYSKKEFNPKVFTINGFGFPRTLNDTLSHIKGMVGQTIRIHMINAGQMYHFPHFHGYHVKILESSHHKHYIGWEKDSYGMAPGESVMVELVPDKPGRFPMHNHNLVTTTVGGNYPGGMMMHIHIHE